MNSFIQQWSQLLLNAFSNAVVIHHPTALNAPLKTSSSSISQEQRLKEKLRKEMSEVLKGTIESLFDWEKIHQGNSFKTFDAALLVVKLLRTTNSEVFMSTNPDTQKIIEEYFSQIDFLPKMKLHPQFFMEKNKHVICIEGLSGVGKSTIIQRFLQHHEIQFPGKYFKISIFNDKNSVHNAIWDIFQKLPFVYQLLFQFLENYRLIYEIIETKSEYDVFIVENYFHSFLVNSILYNSNEELNVESNYKKYFEINAVEEIETKLNHLCLFDWPLDLPMPELVLYLTCPTAVRFARKNIVDLSELNLPKMEQVDMIKSTLYSLIKGPGTIGIDTSESVEDVFTTVFEALDYYGIYAVTRPLPDVSVVDPTPVELKDNSFHEETILKQKSIDFTELPMEPQDVIYNRRISMGVYGMFSKFM